MRCTDQVQDGRFNCYGRLPSPENMNISANRLFRIKFWFAVGQSVLVGINYSTVLRLTMQMTPTQEGRCSWTRDFSPGLVVSNSPSKRLDHVKLQPSRSKVLAPQIHRCYTPAFVIFYSLQDRQFQLITIVNWSQWYVCHPGQPVHHRAAEELKSYVDPRSN